MERIKAATDFDGKSKITVELWYWNGKICHACREGKKPETILPSGAAQTEDTKISA